MLQEDEVNVWLIPLPQDGEIPASVNACLSPEESARAARFVFASDRASFTVAHTALRQILAGYTSELPHVLAIRTAAKGKPYLADHPEIRFNLSHSGAWAMVAIALRREVGIDIEQIRGERSTEDIADRFFAPAEVDELMQTPEHARVQAFFACWSRKEAYIKARGEGLAIPLDSFEVNLCNPASLRKSEDLDRWSICALEAPAGYAAALVVEGTGWRLKRFLWTSRPET